MTVPAVLRATRFAGDHHVLGLGIAAPDGAGPELRLRRARPPRDGMGAPGATLALRIDPADLVVLPAGQ